AIARRLQAALGARRAPGDEPYQNMAGNILGAAANGGNDAALEVLRSFKTPDGAATPVDYYRAGDTANLPPSLVGAGLTAQILGPPTDLALVAQMDNHAHQYLTAGSGDADDARPFDPAFDAGPLVWPKLEGDPHWLEPLYDDADIQKHIADNTPDALAAAAQTADNAINNQSLVVLFRFKGKSMLFCGDAQWGNWANFLFGGAIGAGQATLKPESRDILATLDFLKVGHHGSTNATPMDVVDALRTGCAAMCSTDPGAYGNPDKGTEVPRVPLIQALTAKTNQQLARSDQVSVNGHDPTPNLGPLPAVFSAGPDNSQFVDYTL
ncbi:MAG TPA: hypothetical protein VMT68_17060, partial [Caulobacteraceae bacterium]|nr:hypothetical protein [Caulobacteraceae bacterium]